MAPSLAAEVVARMDAHAAAPPSAATGAEGGGWRDPRIGMAAAAAGGAADGGGGGGASADAAAAGLLGAPFVKAILLAGVRTVNKARRVVTTADTPWLLGRVVLLNALCRPGAATQALDALVGAAGEETLEMVAAASRELHASLQGIAEPTSSLGRDVASRAFLRWARMVKGRL